MRSCGEPENNEDSPPGAEPQYQLQQAAMRNLHQVPNAQPAGEDAPVLESQASLTYSGEVSWIYTPNELKYSKKASALASVPAATDPRSLTTRSSMILGGEDEEVASPVPCYPDGIPSPGSLASWSGRYGSSIHILDDVPDHLRTDSLMADPPETGLSDEEDAGSYTTLAGEEDRRSLTPAPVSVAISGPFA
ncbi:hypothetical protein BHE90_016008 [Fusarium euwallaceae]|uniref:Uncharacterized protein n=1 Tax=Fusarium euwallaceae TaxID=1147111 RepID=A0A430L1Q3_9HYPO|nr:hypothetical protein BHE90_016008 [Fusarium euwallaceae]